MAPSCGSEEKNESSDRKFDQERIDALNELSIYDYDRQLEEYSNPILDFFLRLFQSIFNFFNSPIAFTLLILGIAALVVLIIKRGKSGLLMPEKQNDSLELITVDDLEKTDYQALLDLALAAEDMRLSTRYTFLLALQYLQLKKKIDWHKEKTNHEYLLELKPDLQQPFSALIRAYEYIWYGEMDISIQVYPKIKGYFNHLKKIES